MTDETTEDTVEATVTMYHPTLDQEVEVQTDYVPSWVSQGWLEEKPAKKSAAKKTTAKKATKGASGSS